MSDLRIITSALLKLDDTMILLVNYSYPASIESQTKSCLIFIRCDPTTIATLQQLN